MLINQDVQGKISRETIYYASILDYRAIVLLIPLSLPAEKDSHIIEQWEKYAAVLQLSLTVIKSSSTSFSIIFNTNVHFFKELNWCNTILCNHLF